MDAGWDVDEIHINDVEAQVEIGCLGEERGVSQKIVFTIKLFTDTRPCGESDRLEDTIDYKTVNDDILAFVQETHFFTLEKLGHEMARFLLLRFQPIAVELVLNKVEAPHMQCRYPTLVIRRRREK